MIVKVKMKPFHFQLIQWKCMPFLNIVILYYLLMRRDVWFANHLVYYFINVFAKNYVVINCLIELIRFIVYNVTTYIPANLEFLTNST